MFEGKEYIYEVYKTRSFSKAAANLYISQPSLSATVKKVETRLGEPLFDRSTSPVQLTACGREYIRCVEQIMDIEKGFDGFLNNMTELKTGDVSIGGSNLFASYILPPIISAFKERYPLVAIKLVEADTSALEKLLFTGQIDIMIDNYPFSKTTYERHAFCTEQLLLAVPGRWEINEQLVDYRMTADDIRAGKHLAAETREVPLICFRDLPFLFLRSGNDTRRRADKICQVHDLTPNIILKLDQIVTAYNLTCYGMGISFLSDTLVSHIKPDEHVVYYKLAPELATRQVYLYYKHGKYITKAMDEFIKMTYTDPVLLP